MRYEPDVLFDGIEGAHVRAGFAALRVLTSGVDLMGFVGGGSLPMRQRGASDLDGCEQLAEMSWCRCRRGPALKYLPCSVAPVRWRPAECNTGCPCRAVRRGDADGMGVIEVVDIDAGRRALVAGALCCLCGGRLRAWGHARTRTIRHLAGA
jgi:hypothetical protein